MGKKDEIKYKGFLPYAIQKDKENFKLELYKAVILIALLLFSVVFL